MCYLIHIYNIIILNIIYANIIITKTYWWCNIMPLDWGLTREHLTHCVVCNKKYISEYHIVLELQHHVRHPEQQSPWSLPDMFGHPEVDLDKWIAVQVNLLLDPDRTSSSASWWRFRFRISCIKLHHCLRSGQKVVVVGD